MHAVFNVNTTVLKMYTYNLESGRFLAMAMSDSRPGMTARLETPFFDTSNTMLELFYWIVTGPEPPKLTIGFVYEELDTVFEGADFEVVLTQRWYSFVKELGDGIKKIVIQGQRNTSGSGAIYIDDVVVKTVKFFYRKIFSD